MQVSTYQQLVQVGNTPVPRHVLLSLPGASVRADVLTLEDVLGTVCAEKNHRGAMRAFLDRHVKATRVAMQANGAAGRAGDTAAANPLDLVGQAGGGTNVRDLQPLGQTHIEAQHSLV